MPGFRPGGRAPFLLHDKKGGKETCPEIPVPAGNLRPPATGGAGRKLGRFAPSNSRPSLIRQWLGDEGGNQGDEGQPTACVNRARKQALEIRFKCFKALARTQRALAAIKMIVHQRSYPGIPAPNPLLPAPRRTGRGLRLGAVERPNFVN